MGHKKPEIDTILDCLWAIKDNDQFYFNTYGKDMIEGYIEKRIQEKLSEINLDKSKK